MRMKIEERKELKEVRLCCIDRPLPVDRYTYEFAEETNDSDDSDDCKTHTKTQDQRLNSLQQLLSIH